MNDALHKRQEVNQIVRQSHADLLVGETQFVGGHSCIILVEIYVSNWTA